MQPSQADHLYMSESQLEQASELIVIGEYLGDSFLTQATGAEEVHVGVVRIERILKGRIDAKLLLLRLPPRRASGLRLSNETVPLNNQKGLWYLVKTPDGLYAMDRPDRFVPMDKAKGRIDRLSAP